jgi:hypothetical protein
MTALIELVCRAHVHFDEVGPLIALVESRWAYCAGRATADHEWIRIAPTRREYIGDLSQVQAREAS